EVCASVGKAWLFADRLLAYQRLIPRKIIEGAPAIENDELAPPVGNPRGAVEVLFAPRGIDVAALHWAGVKDTDLENVSLRRLDRRARLRGVWHRRETGPQFGKHGAALITARMSAAMSLEYRPAPHAPMIWSPRRRQRDHARTIINLSLQASVDH